MSANHPHQTLEARLAEFIQGQQGKTGVGDTPGNIGQCVGLVEYWLDKVGMPHIWGNAKDLLDQADPVFYERIDNNPTNFPAPGDIVVWGDTWGAGDGHTGIAVTGNRNSFTAFEQNDPTDSPPHLKVYTYGGVLGWLKLRGKS